MNEYAGIKEKNRETEMRKMVEEEVLWYNKCRYGNGRGKKNTKERRLQHI